MARKNASYQKVEKQRERSIGDMRGLDTVLEEEVEVGEEATSEETVAEAEEEAEETIHIDLNTTLLEIMVERTELLEKLVSREVETTQALAKLEEYKAPLSTKKGRRRRR